jgi:hypothetical protein
MHTMRRRAGARLAYVTAQTSSQTAREDIMPIQIREIAPDLQAEWTELAINNAEHRQFAYTIAHWTVKPGAEAAFISERKRFSEWPLDHRAVESFALIEANNDPGEFASVGLWTRGGCNLSWAAFLERWGRCRALCERTRSNTYRLAA